MSFFSKQVWHAQIRDNTSDTTATFWRKRISPPQETATCGLVGAATSVDAEENI